MYLQLQQNKQKIQQQQQQQQEQQQQQQHRQQHQQQHHHQKQSSQNSSALSDISQNPFSPSSNDGLSQDQDMRIPLNPTTSNDKLVELSNQDVDMRILAVPHRTGSDQSKHKKSNSDSYSKNTQSEKTHEQASSRKLIDYSQYLKDANIDLNQSDLEDPIGKFVELIFD